MIKCKIVFYNFDWVRNRSQPCSVGHIPKGPGDAMAGRVRFLDESHSVIFTDKGIQFFSTRVETSPELVTDSHRGEYRRHYICSG